MKVLHVLGATEDDGGILTVLRGLSEVGTALGCQHVVCVNSAYREIRSPPLRYRTSPHFLGEAVHPWMLAVAALRAVPELRRLVAEERPDVVHLHSRGAMPLTLFRTWCGRVPWLVTFHAYARRVRLYWWLACHGGALTTVLTPRMAQHYGLAPAPCRFEVISECCFDRLFEGPLAQRRQAHRPDDPIQLVGLGSVIREKNWRLILEAFQRLDPRKRQSLQFHHYGPTPKNPMAETYARELEHLRDAFGLRRECVFHGAVPEVETVLRGANWFVLPSTNEPCSVALIEALALGLPVLVSASGGNLDIVSSERTGLMFLPEDVEGLADCLRRIVLGKAHMAGPERIRESVRTRRASAVATQYLALYERLMNSRTHRQPRSAPRSASTDPPAPSQIVRK